MRGRKITPEQIETIKAIYAETGSVTKAADASGVSRPAASNYVKSDDEFDEVRREKRHDIIEAIAHARRLYAEHLAKPDIVAATDSRDAATVLGILTDKHQLLTGQATERRESRNLTSARDDLKRRIAEMTRRRAEGNVPDLGDLKAV
jgi:hypothetical protein